MWQIKKSVSAVSYPISIVHYQFFLWRNTSHLLS